MSQQLVSQVGAFTTATKNIINQNFEALFAGLLQVGNVFFCDPTTTVAVANQDGSAAKPFSTLLAAYNACVSGNNDVVVLIGDGTTANTARVNSAFTWSKNATHLLGICSPVLFSQRARIAPTSSTTAFTPFITVSGSGCVFKNIQWFHGFATGTTSQICMVVTGSRNWFKNCHIAGMGDNESAQSAGSRSLKVGSGGSGENVFEDCVIGVDTITRTQANASLEFAGATPRNVFINCLFPFMGSAAGVLGILGTGNGCVDRFNLFEKCSFINAIKSTSTQMTALGSFTTAAPGGMIVFKDCLLIGATEFGDANMVANAYVDMAAPSASDGGIGVNPS